MRTRLGHRKRIRHDDAAGEARELTFSCDRRLKRLRMDSRCELLAEAIDRAIKMQHYELMARVRRGDGECTDATEGERVVLSSRCGPSTGGQATSGTRA